MERARADCHFTRMIDKHDLGERGAFVECLFADIIDRLRADKARERRAPVKRVLPHAVGVRGEGDGF